MAITIPSYQSLFFKSLEDRTVNTGSNLIVNGKFDTDLSGWTADDYIWQAGIAAYNWTYGCYRGSIKQEYISLLANNRYKITFKYRAINPFDIVVRLWSMTSPLFDALPEQLIPANTDGNWHTLEFFVNTKINSTQYLLLGSRATGEGDYSSCHDTGNSENGIFFDDVSIYAQQSVISCGDCDTVIMDSNKPIEFQVKGRKLAVNNLYPNSEFETNPFNPISSTNLVFDISSIPAVNEYFVIYINDKVFIINYGGYNAGTPSSYAVLNYNIYGNVHYFQINQYRPSGITLSNVQDAVHTALDYIDGVVGTISSRSGATMTMMNVPAGSYLDNSFGWLTSINTIGVAAFTTIVRNGYYNNLEKNFCYFNSGLTLEKFEFTNTVNLTTNKYYIIRIEWVSAFSDWQNEKIIISDGVNPNVEFPLNIVYSLTGKFIEIEYKAQTTGNHSIKISVEDAETAHNYQLCFDNISVYEIKLDDIEIQAKDCQGNLTTLPHTQIPYGENVLIQINNVDFPVNTPFQIIINDSQSDALGLQHFSQKIELLDFNNIAACKIEKLLKIQWTDTCKFGDIDYKNLPFENEFYIRGFIIRKPLDKRERIQTTNPDGSLKTIFNHSIAKIELRIAQYGKDLHRVLERAVEHGSLIINGNKYYLDDAASYTPGDFSGNGLATARVDLIESGSEVVKTACCC